MYYVDKLNSHPQTFSSAYINNPTGPFEKIYFSWDKIKIKSNRGNVELRQMQEASLV